MSHFIYDVEVMMQLADRNRMVAPTTDYIKRPPSLQRKKEILLRLKIFDTIRFHIYNNTYQW